MSWAPIAAVCRAELRRTVRDRTALLFVVVLPIAVISFSSVVFGAVGGEVRLGVFDPAGRVAGELDRYDSVAVERFDRADALERDVQTGATDAGLVVTAGDDGGFTGRLLIDPTRPETDTARFAVRDALRTVAAFDITVRALVELRELDVAAAEEAAAEVQTVPPVTVETTLVGDEDSVLGDRSTYPAIGNLILFMFVNSLAVGAQLVAARQAGVLHRSLGAPVSAAGLAAGYLVARVVFALVQAAIILVVGALVFDVHWGDPVAVGAVVALFSVISAAAGLVLGTLATTPEQAPAIGVPVAMGLGMLGGCLWPLFVVPVLVRRIGHATPHAWAVDGLSEVAFDGAAIGSIGVELLVLTMFAVALTVAAIVSLRRLALD